MSIGSSFLFVQKELSDAPYITNPSAASDSTDGSPAAQRTGLLAVLRELKPKIWSCSAIVTGAGNVPERTVHFYAQWMASHERPNLKQIKRIASTPRK